MTNMTTLETHCEKNSQKVAKKTRCDICDYTASRHSDYLKHIATRKHQWKQNCYKKVAKKVAEFHCELCDYSTSRKSNYDKHLLTLKHKWKQNGNTRGNKNEHESDKNICICGKSYVNRSGLYKHQKTCVLLLNSTYNDEDNTNASNDEIPPLNVSKNSDNFTKIVENMMHHNKTMMCEIVNVLSQHMNNSSNTTNIQTQNIQNNNFNLNVFLNTQCKNAINFSEFIESLPITPKLFDDTCEKGLTEGLTRLLIDGLNNMNIMERPIHCTDKSRRVLYVKENNTWQKDQDHNIVKDGIKTLAVKQRSSISIWQEANPGWNTSDNKQIEFSNLIHNALELCETHEKDQNKIIKALSSTTYLDKKHQIEN